MARSKHGKNPVSLDFIESIVADTRTPPMLRLVYTLKTGELYVDRVKNETSEAFEDFRALIEQTGSKAATVNKAKAPDLTDRWVYTCNYDQKEAISVLQGLARLGTLPSPVLHQLESAREQYLGAIQRYHEQLVVEDEARHSAGKVSLPYIPPQIEALEQTADRLQRLAVETNAPLIQQPLPLKF